MMNYIGGKYHQSRWMSEYLPQGFKEYAEVFGGAMWFYIKGEIAPVKGYYNDIDPLMVNMFTCFKEYKEFIKRMENLPAYDVDTFNHMKNIIQTTQTTNFKIPNMEFAVAHAYVISHIFSGFTKDIWRPNLKMVNGRTNPGIMGNHSIVKRLRTNSIQQKFDKLEISNLNCNDFIKKIDSDDLFLYVDPPYWNTEGHYRHGEFNKQDHIDLLDLLKKLKCKWMLSYYDFDILRDALPEKDFVWKRKIYAKSSGAVKKGDKKGEDEEIIIMNYQTNKVKLFEHFFKG